MFANFILPHKNLYARRYSFKMKRHTLATIYVLPQALATHEQRILCVIVVCQWMDRYSQRWYILHYYGTIEISYCTVQYSPITLGLFISRIRNFYKDIVLGCMGRQCFSRTFVDNCYAFTVIIPFSAFWYWLIVCTIFRVQHEGHCRCTSIWGGQVCLHSHVCPLLFVPLSIQTVLWTATRRHQTRWKHRKDTHHHQPIFVSTAGRRPLLAISNNPSVLR